MDDEFDARAIQVLLRCVQSPQDRFSASEALKNFRARHQDIGRQVGKTVYLSIQDKEKIRNLLRSDGIDPWTPPDAWRGTTRTEALVLGNNEKWTSEPVKRRRIAIKSVHPDQPLVINGESLRLPRQSHLEVDYLTIDVSQHDWIVVVENWETFNDLHLAIRKLAFPGQSPLAVWRGDSSMTRADAMLAWLNILSQPVAAFVDFDPEGLVIARALPRMHRLVAPEFHVLEEMLAAGVRGRFLAQIGNCQPTLDGLCDDILRPVWEIIRRSGKALPQEKFTCEIEPDAV